MITEGTTIQELDKLKEGWREVVIEALLSANPTLDALFPKFAEDRFRSLLEELNFLLCKRSVVRNSAGGGISQREMYDDHCSGR
ncbi:MAG: hypothetical protein UT48_C0035G0005 [Parcubacteria group bacterium GW2011_GWE2_39_37]|nr:MAG: hypothetical protein UT48_C0035G0005 [Parcubacteria group bacterium GW2011_GWE2_39_37]